MADDAADTPFATPFSLPHDFRYYVFAAMMFTLMLFRYCAAAITIICCAAAICRADAARAAFRRHYASLSCR